MFSNIRECFYKARNFLVRISAAYFLLERFRVLHLVCIINKAIQEGEFLGIDFPNVGLHISHFLYADDAILVGEWYIENVEATARILRIFHLCSGLKINLFKSQLFGVGVEEVEVNNMAKILGCRVGSFPFDYLGVKVGMNMNKLLIGPRF